LYSEMCDVNIAKQDKKTEIEEDSPTGQLLQLVPNYYVKALIKKYVNTLGHFHEMVWPIPTYRIVAHLANVCEETEKQHYSFPCYHTFLQNRNEPINDELLYFQRLFIAEYRFEQAYLNRYEEYAGFILNDAKDLFLENQNLSGILPLLLPQPSWKTFFKKYGRMLLKKCQLTNSDIVLLAQLPDLFQLLLSYNEVSDVSALQHLTQLKALGLDHTQVSDVSALQHLTQLQKLWLNHTQVSDILPLTELKQLKRLDLYATPVPEEDVAELRAALPNTLIIFTKSDAQQFYNENHQDWDEEDRTHFKQTHDLE